MRCRVLLLLVVTFTCGCGPREMSSAVLANSEKSYDKGVELFNSKDLDGAEKELSKAISGGGLDVDRFGDALVKRALCYANQKKFDEAHKDLEVAEQGAPELATVYKTRADVYQMQGDVAKSQEFANKAKATDAAATTVVSDDDDD